MASWLGLGRFTPRKSVAAPPTPKAITHGSSSSSSTQTTYDPARVPFTALTGTYVHLPQSAAGSVVHVGFRADEGEDAMEDEREDDGLEGDDPELAGSAYLHASTGLLLRLINDSRTLEVRNTRTRTTGEDALRITFPERLLALPHGAAGPVYIDSSTGRTVIVLLSQTAAYRIDAPELLGCNGDGLRVAADRMERYEEGLPDTMRHLGGVRGWEVLNERDVVVHCLNGLVRATWDAHSHAWSYTQLHAGWRGTTLLAACSHLTPLTALAYGLTPERTLRAWNVLTGAQLRSVDLVPGAQAHAQGPLASGEVIILPDAGEDGEGHRVVVYLSGPPRSVGSYVVVDVRMEGGVLVDMSVEVVVPADVTARDGVLRGMAVRPVYALGAASNGDVSIEQDSEQGSEVVGHRLFALYTIEGGRSLLQWTDISAHLASRHTGEQQMVHLGSAADSSTDIDAPSSLARRWRTIAAPGQDPSTFDASYFDGLLPLDAHLAPEDVSREFLAHIFHPGRFSVHTIETCLDDYIEALEDEVDEDGPASPLAAVLDARHPTLFDRVAAIVSCALETPTDPRTGAVAVDALLRLVRDQWMAYWVRLLASDRQARLPVSLDALDARGRLGESVIVVTRQGLLAARTMDTAELLLDAVASLDQEEQALSESWTEVKAPMSAQYDELLASRPSVLRTSHPALVGSSTVSSLLTVFKAAHDLSGRIEDMPALEQDLIDAQRRPAAQAPEEFGAEIYAQHVQPVFEDVALANNVEEQIQQTGNPQRTLNHLLDLFAVMERANTTGNTSDSRTSMMLTIAAFMQSAQARHATALALLILALHLGAISPQHDDDSPAADATTDLISRALVTYHKCATLHWLSEQDAREAQVMANRRETEKGDDLQSEFTRLRVNGNDRQTEQSKGLSATYSALFCALNESADLEVANVDSLGALTRAASLLDIKIASIPGSVDVSASMAEVHLARDLFESGQPTTALAYCDRFPPQAGLTYVMALSHLSLGVVDEATQSFDHVAGVLGLPGWQDDSENALGSVLPSSVLAGSTSYNRYVMGLFELAGATDAMIVYAERAIEEANPGDPTLEDLYRRVFKGRLDAEEFEAAYHCMLRNPFADLTSDVPGKDRPLGNLINDMCHVNELQKLFSFSFIGNEDALESELVFKARNSDPLAFPNYHQVLYAYYMQRKKYRDAGRAMYQQGQRLRDHSDIRADNFFEVAAFQAQCYLSAISAFHQVKPSNAWATVPATSRDALSLHDRKRRRIRSNIPSTEFSQYSKDVEIVTLQDIQREYTLVLSTLKTMSMLDIQTPDASPTAKDIVALQCEASLYDDAFATARDLQEDMTPIFANLTEACMSIAENAEGDEGDREHWLDNCPTTCAWHGSAKDRTRRYLQLQLQRHGGTSDRTYAEVVTEVFLANRAALPIWLVDQQLKCDPEALIRRALRHGQIEQAAKWGQELLRHIPRQPTKISEGGMQPMLTPVGVLAQVVRAGSDETYGPAARGAAQRLQEELDKRAGSTQAIKV